VSLVPNKIVLVVDDDSAIRGLVRAVLQREHFDVEEAHTGHQAIARIGERHYDAVVLDLMMGEGSGHEVLDVLSRARPGVKCVVVISAASTASIALIEAANVEAKLRKPFDIDALVDAVRRCAD
jgi:DNA-binding NtrC family response regulator